VLSDNQKFLKLLSTLKKEEVNHFKSYLKVANPKIEYQKQCTDLLEVLIDNAKEVQNEYGQTYLFFPEGISKRIAHEKFSHATNNGEGAMSQRLSYLCKAFEFYIGQSLDNDFKIEIVHQEYLAQLIFLEFLQKRRLADLFDKYFKKFQKRLEDAKKSEQLYFVQKATEQLRIDQQLLFNRRISTVSLSELLNLTARYNFLSMIKLACSQINFDIGMGVANDEREDKINYYIDFDVEVVKFSEDELLQLYYFVYLAFTKDASIGKVEDLIKNIYKHKETIASDEIYKLFKLVQNICLQQTRKRGDSHYRDLLLRIYQYLDKLELIVSDNTITIRLFLNIVNESGKTKNFDWGHQFIEKYSSRLPLNVRKKIGNIGKGLLFFENEEYQKAIDILDNHRMYIENDPNLENNRNILIIKAFYELKQFEYLAPRVERHIDYLRRTPKLSSDTTKPNILFLQMLIRLVKFIVSIKLKRYNKKIVAEKVDELLERINKSTKRIDNRVWLLEKVGEVKK